MKSLKSRRTAARLCLLLDCTGYAWCFWDFLSSITEREYALVFVNLVLVVWFAKQMASDREWLLRLRIEKESA